MTVTERLFTLQDTKYRDFSARLTPNISKDAVIGVRAPAIRALAKELYGTDEAARFMAELPHKYFDENNLHGALICRIRDYASAMAETERFLPYIDNWAVCDSFCNSLAPRFPGDGAALWDFLRPLYPDSREYYARVACVVQLSHFVDSEHLEEGLSLLQQVKHPGYYAKMAEAWALSEWYVKFPQAVGQLLAQQTLEPWVQNKAIQKVRESRRVSKAEKDALLRYKLQPTP